MNKNFDTALASYELTSEKLDELCNALGKKRPSEALESLEKIANAYFPEYVKQKPLYKLHCGDFKTGAILCDLSPRLLDIYCKAFAKSCFDDADGNLLQRKYVREHAEYINSNRLRAARFEVYLKDNNLPKPLYYLDFYERALRIEHVIAKQYLDEERPDWYDDEDVLSKVKFINQIMDIQKEVINEQMVYTTPF